MSYYIQYHENKKQGLALDRILDIPIKSGNKLLYETKRIAYFNTLNKIFSLIIGSLAPHTIQIQLFSKS